MAAKLFDNVVGALTDIILGEKGTKGEWEKENRYKSFASERESCHVKWYVDGKDYFYAVSEALMSAKEEIFIEDWWLSPELVYRILTRKFFSRLFFKWQLIHVLNHMTYISLDIVSSQTTFQE